MRLAVVFITFLFALPASALAASPADQFQSAAQSGLITAAQADQAILDFQKLDAAPGADWRNMASGIKQLAGTGDLATRAPMVIHALRVFALKGDRPIGERVKSGPAAVVQRYAGSGWQVMPLASASRVNALAGGSFSTPTVVRAAEALQGLLVDNGSSSRFEYPFPWLGGKPGWISGMTQSVLACAFARMFERTGDRIWQQRADRAIDPLLSRPPRGVSLDRSDSLGVLLYPWRTKFNVMNAQLWSTWALWEVSQNLPGPSYRNLYEMSSRFSLSSMPSWISGEHWSLYASGKDPLAGKPASKSYHYLSVQALRRLCVDDARFCPWAERFGAGVPASISSRGAGSLL